MLIICLVKAFLWNIFSELGSFECSHRMKHLLNLRASSPSGRLHTIHTEMYHLVIFCIISPEIKVGRYNYTD